MPTFSYQATNSSGEQVKGTVEGVNRDTAIEDLMHQNLKPREVVLVATEVEKKKGLSREKVKTNDLVLFTRQMSTMVSAGVPLLRALTTLQEQAENPVLKAAIVDIVAEIQGGAQLADALEKHPNIFSDIYVNMVRAGESAGIVDDILKRLATQVEKNASMKKKIKGAMTYPVVLLSLTVVAFFGLMIFVIPQIGDTLKGLGGPDAKLPALTQGMLDVSDFMIKYWYIVIGILFGLIFGIRAYIKTPSGRHQLHALILKAPIAGMLTTKIAVASFTRTFSALIGSGVSVVEALRVTGKSLGNDLFKEEVDKAALDVVNGKQLSKALEGSTLFPVIVSQMLAVGEETGQTDTVLVKVAEFYEEEVDTAIASMSSLLEPIMIVIMGAAVGLIAAGVMGPIASMSQNVS
jgi:type IV pilus assembly protein PilC